MTDLPAMSPLAFRDFLSENAIGRFFLVWNEEQKTVRASHPLLEPLARMVAADSRDFDRHEGFFAQLAPRTGVLQGAAVHRTCRGQAAGGVRFWHYDTVEEFVRDGLRLAKGMTHKNALAGIWWGGGKGVMTRGIGEDESDPAVRRRIYEEYGEFMTSLRGCYVTAEDVGTCVEDMAAIFSNTRFTTCIPPQLGGSGNPSAPTARGVVRGMEAALHFLDMGTLEGKFVAIQGLGHVGEPLVGLLHDRKVARIIGSDIDPSRERALRSRFPNLDLTVRIVQRGDNTILAEPCDIVAPCATGAILGSRTIAGIRAPIVCGAANNQLEDPEQDDLALAAAARLPGQPYGDRQLRRRVVWLRRRRPRFRAAPRRPLEEQHLQPVAGDPRHGETERQNAGARGAGDGGAAIVRAPPDLGPPGRADHPLAGRVGLGGLRRGFPPARDRNRIHANQASETSHTA
jgi:glutamate dehydrogenase/leucine dehydrogenase